MIRVLNETNRKYVTIEGDECLLLIDAGSCNSDIKHMIFLSEWKVGDGVTSDNVNDVISYLTTLSNNIKQTLSLIEKIPENFETKSAKKQLSLNITRYDNLIGHLTELL